MDDDHFAMLAERHRRVLRLYYDRLRLKEIARELSLSENSVNTYLTEAVQILGAPGRRAAATALVQREDPSRSSRYRVPVPASAVDDGLAIAVQRSDKPAKGAGFLPLRPRDGTPNRLSLHARLVWMVALLIMLVTGVAVAIAVYSVYVKPMEGVFR